MVTSPITRKTVDVMKKEEVIKILEIVMHKKVREDAPVENLRNMLKALLPPESNLCYFRELISPKEDQPKT